MNKRVYEFGQFRLDTTKRLLSRGGLPVSVTPKVFDILVLLVENSDRVVEKAELMEAMWPGVFVEERNLAQNIFMLRRALGESDSGPVYIQTLPKRGYRFVAPAREASAERPSLWGEQIPSSLIAVGRIHIAALPFRLLNIDASEQYLGVGIADSLITKLSRLKQIIVRPTSSVLKYTAHQEEPPSIGRQLGVRFFVEGSIRRVDERIRVTAQLVDSSDGSLLWADSFDENFTDIFTLEDHLSNELAAALSLKPTTEETALLAKRYTENTEAYQFYLRGRYSWNRRTFEGLTKGIEYFKQAIEADPNYAFAYAGLADCHIVIATYSMVRSSEAGPLARAAAAKALEIEEPLAEAHSSLAFTHLVYDWDWAAAETEFKRAIDLNPTYATAHHWYGLYLTAMGRADESIGELETAQRLDPLSHIIGVNLAWMLYFARQYDRAIEQCLKVSELEPGFWRPYLNLGWCYVEKGVFGRAIDAFSKANGLNDTPVNLTALGRAYALAGKADEARKILDRLIELRESRYVSPYYLAELYLGLDEKEQVFDCLEKALEDRVWFLVFQHQEPMFDGIRSDPKFAHISRRMGLPRPSEPNK